MEIHIIDCNGRELKSREIKSLKIWNNTINSACKRIKNMAVNVQSGDPDGIAK